MPLFYYLSNPFLPPMTNFLLQLLPSALCSCSCPALPTSKPWPRGRRQAAALQGTQQPPEAVTTVTQNSPSPGFSLGTWGDGGGCTWGQGRTFPARMELHAPSTAVPLAGCSAGRREHLEVFLNRSPNYHVSLRCFSWSKNHYIN